MAKNNIIVDKSYKFGLRIVMLYMFLKKIKLSENYWFNS